MTTKITQPVANGKTKISSFLETASPDATFIVVSVIADQPLILNVQQAYDEDFFDSIGAAEYTDVGAETTFRFPRVGVKNFFTLSNTSGTDCTFTRAFAEFRNQTSSNIVAIPDVIDTNDVLSHTKLDTVNNNLNDIDNTLNTGVIDTCSKLCRPLQVKSVFVKTAGETAINLLDGSIKLVSFIYAHSDNQGLLSFYDAAASSAAPTVSDTAYFLVPSTTNTISSPSLPTSTFINFNDGLWIRVSSNIDPGNSISEAATITLFYES